MYLKSLYNDAQKFQKMLNFWSNSQYNDDKKTLDLFFCSRSQHYGDQENIYFEFMLLKSHYHDRIFFYKIMNVFIFFSQSHTTMMI